MEKKRVKAVKVLIILLVVLMILCLLPAQRVTGYTGQMVMCEKHHYPDTIYTDYERNVWAGTMDFLEPFDDVSNAGWVRTQYNARTYILDRVEICWTRPAVTINYYEGDDETHLIGSETGYASPGDSFDTLVMSVPEIESAFGVTLPPDSMVRTSRGLIGSGAHNEISVFVVPPANYKFTQYVLPVNDNGVTFNTYYDDLMANTITLDDFRDKFTSVYSFLGQAPTGARIDNLFNLANYMLLNYNGDGYRNGFTIPDDSSATMTDNMNIELFYFMNSHGSEHLDTVQPAPPTVVVDRTRFGDADAIGVELFTDLADPGQRDKLESYPLSDLKDLGQFEDRYFRLDYFYRLPGGSLSIEKTVAGDGADTNREFDFTVDFTGTGNEAFEYVISPVGIADTVRSGGTIKLKHGQSATIVGLPAGTTYTVTENNYTSENYTTQKTDDSGMITENNTSTAIFTNTYKQPDSSSSSIPPDSSSSSSSSDASSSGGSSTPGTSGTSDSSSSSPSSSGTSASGGLSSPSGDSYNGFSSPQTSDSQNMLVWIILALTMALGILGLVILKKQRQEKEPPP